MIITVNELPAGPALDYIVATLSQDAEFCEQFLEQCLQGADTSFFSPSTRLEQAQELVDSKSITPFAHKAIGGWAIKMASDAPEMTFAPTLPLALVRFYLAIRFVTTFDLPEQLAPHPRNES